jgi:DNA-binding NtrC family response regulator
MVGLSVLPQLQQECPASRPLLTFKVGMRLGDLEKQAIQSALAHARGNKPMAARLLGVGLRTIYRRFDLKKPETEIERRPHFRDLEPVVVSAYAANGDQ